MEATNSIGSDITKNIQSPTVHRYKIPLRPIGRAEKSSQLENAEEHSDEEKKHKWNIIAPI